MNDVLSAESLENAVATGIGGFASNDPKTLTHGGSLKKENYTTRGRPQKGNAHWLKKPTRPRLKPDDRIVHIEHGAGTIIQEWGCWLSCSGCFEEIPNGKECKCGRGGGIKHWVSGRGTYDVEFDDGTQRPCHQDRFTEAKGVKYPVEIGLTIGAEIAESSDMPNTSPRTTKGAISFEGHTPLSISAHHNVGDPLARTSIDIEFGSILEAEQFYDDLIEKGYESKDVDFDSNGGNVVVTVTTKAIIDRSA